MTKKETEDYKAFLNEEENKTCQACGGSLELEKVNLEDYQGGKLYLMEKVPAYVCQDCGEIWVPEPIMADFMKMIETVKTQKHRNTESIETQKGEKKNEKK